VEAGPTRNRRKRFSQTWHSTHLSGRPQSLTSALGPPRAHTSTASNLTVDSWAIIALDCRATRGLRSESGRTKFFCLRDVGLASIGSCRNP